MTIEIDITNILADLEKEAERKRELKKLDIPGFENMQKDLDKLTIRK
jgi:hypothetical protein